MVGQEARMPSRMKAIWQNRRVVGLLVRRDLKVKYQKSVLGYAWSMLEPLAMAAVYFFVFGIVLQADRGMPEDVAMSGGLISDGGAISPAFLLYLVTGVLAWQSFGQSLSDAPKAMLQHSKLITTMQVPREIFPLAAVTSRFVDYLLAFPVVVAFVFVLGGTWTVPGLLIWLPLALITQFTFALGMTLLFSSVNVLIRDVERVVRILSRVLFYGSAIIYPATMVLGGGAPGGREINVPEWAQVLYQLNPLLGIFQMHRAVWFAETPELLPTTLALTTAIGGAVMMLLIGYWMFRRLETSVLKEL
jgi:ABC-2 type transport system permease protein